MAQKDPSELDNFDDEEKESETDLEDLTEEEFRKKLGPYASMVELLTDFVFQGNKIENIELEYFGPPPK